MVQKTSVLKKKNLLLLFITFVVAIAIRFAWFPNNVYFGYDQARDAIVSQEIYKNGDFKIMGPSAGKEGLYHGPAYWYLIGPIYLLFKGNPAFVLAFISILNASGIFLIYFLAKKLFDEKVGLIASFFYAISFSQTQYALYFANPSPAVLSIMVFYLGWALLLFGKNKLPRSELARYPAKTGKFDSLSHLSPPEAGYSASRNKWSWLLIGLGLGLSIQFEFFLIYLFASVLLFSIFFFKEIKQNIKFKKILLGIFSLVLTLSTFVIVEIKYGFRTSKMILGLFLPKSAQSAPEIHFATSNFLGRVGMEVYYDVFRGVPKTREILAICLFFTILIFIFKFKTYRKQFLFILIWILSNLFLDFFGPPQLYYVGIGLSIPVIFIFSFLIERLFKKSKLLAAILLIIFVYGNIHLITKYNPKGPVMDLYVQRGMLLSDEKKVLDYIYSDAKKEKFVVNALTMPYKIKTTWAYLLSWYGMRKYGYLPFWGGEDVPGYAGSLPLPDRREYGRYAIIEPMRGIPEDLRKEFTDSENGYSLPKSIMKVGYFEVEKRIPD